MRAGGSGSRGTRRLQPTGLKRPRRSAKGHETIQTGRADKTNGTERARQSTRQPGHHCRVRADARFIVAGRQVSAGPEESALLALEPIAATALLILKAMDPSPLREYADQFLVDRWPGRSDCGGVHQASEIPAARAVTRIPAFTAIPQPPRAVPHLTRPDLRKLEYFSRSAGALVARPTIKRSSLYDLDFFWMTSANHCNLYKRLQPGWGRTFGSWGVWRAEGRRIRGVARRRAWSRNGLVWRPGTTCGAA